MKTLSQYVWTGLCALLFLTAALPARRVVRRQHAENRRPHRIPGGPPAGRPVLRRQQARGAARLQSRRGGAPGHSGDAEEGLPHLPNHKTVPGGKPVERQPDRVRQERRSPAAVAGRRIAAGNGDGGRPRRLPGIPKAVHLDAGAVHQAGRQARPGASAFHHRPDRLRRKQLRAGQARIRRAVHNRRFAGGRGDAGAARATQGHESAAGRNRRPSAGRRAAGRGRRRREASSGQGAIRRRPAARRPLGPARLHVARRALGRPVAGYAVRLPDDPDHGELLPQAIGKVALPRLGRRRRRAARAIRRSCWRRSTAPPSPSC